MHTRQGVAAPALSKDNAAPYSPFPTAQIPSETPAPVASLTLTGDPMYPREVTREGKTAHSRYCRRSPRRYDWSCHRCLELLRGAAPRSGWQHDFVARKLGQVQRKLF